MNIEALLRPDIAAMEAYTPILPFEVVSVLLLAAVVGAVVLTKKES